MPKSGEEKQTQSDWKKPKLRDALRATGYAFQQAWKHCRAPLIARTVVLVVQAAIPGLQVAVLAAAIRALAASRELGGLAVEMFGALAAITVLSHLTTRLGYLATNAITIRLRLSQAEAFFYSLEAVPLEAFEDPDFHDRSRWGASGVDGVSSLVTNTLWGIVEAGLASIGVLAQLIPASPLLPILVVAVSVPTRILVGRVDRQASIARYGWTASWRKADYWERLLVRRESRAELMHLRLAQVGLDRWMEAKREIWREQGKTARTTFFKLAGLQSIDKGVLLALLAWLGWCAVARSVGPAVVVASVYALQRLSDQLIQFDSGMRTWWWTVAPVTCLLRQVRESGGAVEKPSAFDTFTRLEMRHACFRYPGAEERALEGVDATLEVGKAYAVVGRNGAGKSTFVKLMCGLYAPTDGECLADSATLDDSGRRRLAELSAMAFQDSIRLPVSLRDNLTAGSDTSDESLDRVAALCGLGDLARSLPRGWDTQLGRATEGSVDVSSGQWQRVALARALGRGARLLVFDEPASAQDPLSELNLYRGVVNRDPSRITVVVSHRLAVATLADEVLYFEGGRLAARGTHAEVMRSCASYAADFQEQAKLYQEAADV